MNTWPFSDAIFPAQNSVMDPHQRPALIEPFTPPADALPLPTLSNLSPQALNAIKELMREGESSNTRNSYRSAFRYWGAWHLLRLGKPMHLPLSVDCVLQFIIDHAQRETTTGLQSELPAEVDDALVMAGYKNKRGPLALNTLVHRIAVMSKAHQVHSQPNPCQDGSVRELLSRTRKAYAKRGVLPHKKDALTRDVLERLLETCDNSLRGMRDRALLLFAWSSGGRRRSEVTVARIQDLRIVDTQNFLYILTHSKTNQAGTDLPSNHKPITGRAAQALKAWLVAAQITEGPLFRRIRKGGHLGEPLTPVAVNNIVKQRCALAGVEGNFSAHSIRSGFVTEAGRRNIPLPDTMALTGHQSIATILGYFRSEVALQNSAARLMEDEEVL